MMAATNRTGAFRLVVNCPGSNQANPCSVHVALRPECRFSHPVLHGAFAARFYHLEP